MIITVVSEIIYTSVYCTLLPSSHHRHHLTNRIEVIIHFLNWMFYLISYVPGQGGG